MKCGQFELTDEGLIGPAEYLDARGHVVEQMIAGNHAGYNVALQARPNDDPLQVLLVMVQTDYAGWKGTKQFADLLCR